MKGPLARRMADIAPFRVMELLARARALEAQGRSIVHMEIGEPDFTTPEAVCSAGIDAIQRGAHFYTPALGLPRLREAIADYYQRRYGVRVSSERIVITSGSSGALLLAIAVVVNPGDGVLLADPGYPANRHFVRLMEGEPIGVPVGPDSAYQLTPELLEHHWSTRTAAALVATPSNPTGTVIPLEHLDTMAKLATARGGMLIVDEIYHGLVYDGATETALALDRDVIVVNSFSKYFNMTGWRLGWMVAPERYVAEIDKLSQNVYLSAPTASQYAALAALHPANLELLDERREEFRARRDFLVPALSRLGFEIAQVPQGAFYIYAGCSRLAPDSQAFAVQLLEEAGVAITPGLDFGAHRAHEHVRFAYTRPIAELAEGVRRIAAFLESSKSGSFA
jgi:aspartate/methionine/tyrosine aminotransferase